MNSISKSASEGKPKATATTTQPIDQERLAQAMSAALRILRGDPSITVSVKKGSGDAPIDNDGYMGVSA